MITLTIPVTLRSSAIIVGAVIVGAYVIFGGPSEIRKKRKKKDYIPGLANIGNSCFLNALVQSLASCPQFISWLDSKHKSPSPPLVSALHNLLRVLNNDGDNGGDACAGEVMYALRGHGWIISTEEQDTHELFHALTATIDDELINTVILPSLLDVSWVKTGNADAPPVGDGGVVFRSDCWRQKKGLYCGGLTITKDYGVMDSYLSSIGKRCMNIDKTKERCDVNDTTANSDSVESDGNGETKLYLKEAEVTSAAPAKYGREDLSCDDFGCEDIHKINGHIDDISVSSQENKKVAVNCDSCNLEHSAVFTDQCGNIDSYCSGEHHILGKDAASKTENDSDLMAKVREDKFCTAKSENTIKLLSGQVSRTEKDIEQSCKVVTWKNRADNFDSPFRGYLASQLQCTFCGYKNPAQWTSFESLSLSLPSLPWGEVTLQELLDSYITQERVTDVTCDACTKKAGTNVKTAFTKQLTIGKLPSCLCFHIKRTVWMDNGSAVKRQDHVIFPEFLTMDPYTYVTSVNNQELQGHLFGGREAGASSGASTDILGNISQFQPSSIMSHNASSNEIESSPFFRVTRVRCEQLYRLKAVIVHVGDVFCGHFVTYRRGALGTRTRNRWFYTSDLTVREANLEEVRKAHAYMILYEKVA